MFGFKKKKNAGSVAATANSLREWLSPLGTEIKERLRLDGRVRLLNRKARHHPKSLLVSFLSAMALIGVCDLTVTTLMANRESEPRESSLIKEIVSVDEVIGTMRLIDENRQYPRKVMATVASEGLTLSREIDSINSLKNKTREDSVKLKTKMEKALTIYKLINHEEN